jgi:Protein of unknown function (DUF3168)
LLLQGIYAQLAADSVIVALGAGVYPLLAPKESALPYIVYSQVGADIVSSFDGTNRLQSARLRCSCYGSSYSVAKQVAAAVKNSLNGLFVTLSEGTRVEGSWLEMEDDSVESDLQGTVFASHVDFRMMFVDTTTPADIVVVAMEDGQPIVIDGGGF